MALFTRTSNERPQSRALQKSYARRENFGSWQILLQKSVAAVVEQ
jgi:hypothetical protein